MAYLHVVKIAKLSGYKTERKNLFLFENKATVNHRIANSF